MTKNSFFDSFTSGLSDFASGIGDLFNVGSTVSASSNIKPDDVLKTKSALSALGDYQVPDFGLTDIPDRAMIDGLKNFQAHNGLKVDGVMKPGGPTEATLGQTLSYQGISTADLLEKATTPSITPTPKPDVPKPAPVAASTPSTLSGEMTKPQKPKLPKIDPMTGLEDPLASAPKGKMPTKKQWEEVSKLQQQKATSALIPQGDTVQQRIQSLMTDKRYGDKHDTALRDHVVKQFERAYPGEVQYDETGKMIQPQPVIPPHEVEAYDPDGELRKDTLAELTGVNTLLGGSGDDVLQEEKEIQSLKMANAPDTHNEKIATASTNGEKTAQASSYDNRKEPQNIQMREKERIEKLRTGEAIEIEVHKNPNANGDKQIHEVPKVGYDAVRKHEELIQKMAKKHGTDPDLIRAVMWAENARGHYFGGNAIADKLGLSNSKRPMNINPKIWGNVLGKGKTDLTDPTDNIEAAAIVLKRLESSITGEKDAAKIGTLWNSTGQSETTDFGEYIGRLYKNKPWLKPDPIEGDRNEPEGP